MNFQKFNPFQRILLAAFLALGVVWLYWVFFALHDCVPGLIDDGSHLSNALKYLTEGFFSQIAITVRSIVKGARFYLTHQVLLGTYHTLFGQNLVLWYAANIGLGILSAAAIGYVAFTFTKNIWASVLGASILLTTSPTAETLRGNFGKAEVVMVALMAIGLALWAHSAKSRFQKVYLIAAWLLFALGCISKESGKFVAVSICLPWLLSLIPFIRAAQSEQQKSASLRSLFAIGFFSLVASYLVSWPSRTDQHLGKYFSLEFSLENVNKAVHFYLFESPDFLFILILCTLIYLVLMWNRRNRDDKFLLGGAALIGAWTYSILLLGFQFNLLYYLFVPLFLLSLIASICLSLIPWKKAALVGLLYTLFLIPKLYSLPYMFMTTKAQQLFDGVNYKALLYPKSATTAEVYALDIIEESQLIQEWNLLNHRYKKLNVKSLIYGARSGFKMWGLQDQHRYTDSLKEDPRSPMNSEEKEAASSRYWVMDEWRLQFPKAGDYLTCRFGVINVNKHFLRATMPFEQSVEPFLSLFDKQALTKVGDVSKDAEILDPSTLKKLKVTYGWSFYKFATPMGFLVRDCTPDQWLTKTSSILIPEESLYSSLTVKLQAPQGHSFPIRVWAESDGREISVIDITTASDLDFNIPVKKGEVITLHSSSWFQPSKLGINADTRDLSIRLLEVRGQ